MAKARSGYGRAVVAALALALAGLTAPAVAQDAPRVDTFSPTGTAKAPRQVSARFSQPMVAFGEPRQPAPFVIDCPIAGQARWVDARQWVYDFGDPLPGGVRCRFTLAPDAKALDGSAFDAPAEFVFDTGGPAVLRSLPGDGDEDIDAEQAFILALDAPADAASVREHASCAVDKLAERIPVDVLEGEARAAVLAQRRALGYQYFRVLWKSGARSVEKVKSEDLARAEDALVVLRCRRALPPDSDVRLRWEAGITSTSGIATTAEQALAFHTRPDFTVRTECDRVNAQAACLPMLPLRLVFSAPVPAALAARIEVKDGDGKRYPPTASAAGAKTVEAVSIPGPFPEHATLTVTLPTDFVDDAGRPAANSARFPLTVPLDGYPPLAKFGAEFGIIEAATGGVLPVTLRKVETALPGHTLTPLGGIDARSLRVTDSAAIGQWLRRVEAAMRPSGEWVPDAQGKSVWRETTGEKSVFGDAERGAAKAFTVPNPDGEHAFRVVGIPLTEPGFYVVELESPELGAALLGRRVPRYVATAALVTNLAVHLEWGRESSLLWVTTLDGAAPVADAAVEIADYCTGEVRWRGTTDASGMARVAQSLGEPHGYGGCERWTPAPLIASARLGNDMSFTLSQWQRGISPHDFGMPTGGWPDALIAHTVLDRTLLRAGETVSMKHFLRRHVGQGVALYPQTDNVRAVITHTASNDKVELPLTFDADGVATSTWTLPAEARLGTYRVSLVRSGSQAMNVPTAQFRVEQFRVPSMRAVVQGPTAPQVNPASVPLTIHVGYLSGGSAGGLPVTLRTQVEPRAVGFKHYDGFVFGGKELVEGPESDDDGDAFGWYLRQFGAYRDREGNDASTPVAVRELTLDDAGAAQVTIDRPAGAGPRSLLAELEYQDANGERLASSTRVPLWPAAIALGIKLEGWAGTRDKLRFQVVALDLEGQPVAGRKVKVRLFQRERSAYRKRLIGGFYTYESSSRIKAIDARCAGETDRHGLLSCQIAPGASGELLLGARATDADGNPAVASTAAWVVGDDDWWFNPGDADRMDVLPEKKEYASGDVARFQVRSPFRHATALVSVMREGVLRSFVTEIDGHEPVIEVPITAADAPNVYVSVLAVRGRVSWWQAALGSAARYLHLPWAVDGALPTALVDLGKPAYRYGIGRIAVDWRPHRLDVDVKPAREVYPVRDTAQVDVTVRAADGSALPPGAEVALAAVDEGLLDLSPNDTWDLLRAMMGERGLEVWTSTAQMQVVGKRHFGRKAVPHGGGGGRGPAARERFDSLLLWQDRVTLDADGHARVAVPLNDSLSAFRIVAVAHAGAHRFGSGAATIRTAQDLMLLPGVAPLVREGDSYTAVFTLRNASSRAMQVTASATLTAVGTDAPIGQPSAQTVTLAPGAAHDIAWPVTAPARATAIGWDVHASEQASDKDNRAADHLAIQQTVIPVWPVRVQQATIEQIAGSFSLPAAAPRGALPGRGGIEVALRAHLGDGLEGVREYMSFYSYVCLEQTLSRAVALRDAALWQSVMERLPAYLDRDGLARYFPSDWLPGSDTLTSYVLTVAHEAGWAIPDATRERMQNALTRFVNGEITRDSVLPTTDLALRKTAAIAALARYGRANASMLSSFNIEPALWPTSGLLDLLDVTRHLSPLPPGVPPRADLERLLRARLDASGTTLRFATERNDALWWLMISGDVNAARAVLEVLDSPDWRADMPRLVRGLLGRLEHGHWNTTVANAWGVLAMEKFSAAFEATPVTGDTRLDYGDATRSVAWQADQVPAPVELPWVEGTAPLHATHQGGGKPWAIIASRAAVPRTEPVEAGFHIERTVTPVVQKTPGAWHTGDVARVTLTVHAQSDAGWVVVDDPIPAGASVLGTGLGRDSSLLTQGEKRAGWVHPVYEERRFDAFRAYYSFVPAGQWTVEYTLRLNTVGDFNLPPTHVEAMYAPEVNAELPLDPVRVNAP